MSLVDRQVLCDQSARGIMRHEGMVFYAATRLASHPNMALLRSGPPP